MTVTHKVDMDMDFASAHKINVVQGDKYTRSIAISMYSNGTPWEPPEGAVAVVNYEKQDGTRGKYNRLPDDSLAYHIASNVLTVVLAPQVLTTAGTVKLNVTLVCGSEEISTLTVFICVEKNLGAGIQESDNYENVAFPVIIDPTLTISGRAADAEMTGANIRQLLALIANKGQVRPEFANSVAECTDTSKLYVLPDGYIYAYMAVKTGGYTNQIPISTDTDGGIYNGTGYKTASRCNSSGEVVGIDNPDCEIPTFTTGFIPAKTGDIIRLKNCYIDGSYSTTGDAGIYGSAAWGLRSGLYDSSKTKVAVESWGNLYSDAVNVFSDYTKDSDGHITQFTIACSGVSYIRLSLAPTGDPADAIVTVNEKIDGNGEAEVYYQWATTGHAFTPADYEDRIIAAEENITQLQKAVAGDMAVFGIVDDEKNIIMTGTLAEGTYTLKYLHEDGSETEIGTFTMK